jgi:hypothetical protein
MASTLHARFETFVRTPKHSVDNEEELHRRTVDACHDQSQQPRHLCVSRRALNLMEDILSSYYNYCTVSVIQLTN